MAEAREINGSVSPGCTGFILWIAAICALWSIAAELGEIRKEMTLLRCSYIASHGAMCPEAKHDPAGKS